MQNNISPELRNKLLDEYTAQRLARTEPPRQPTQEEQRAQQVAFQPTRRKLWGDWVQINRTG